ncbi:MAG: serine hydrolase [Bacteroidota bacterium]
MTKIKALLLFIACISILPLRAQDRVSEIEHLVAFCEENGMFNGNILVAEKGEIIFQRSVGLADFEKDIPLDPNTSFCLGSISKQFTAFAIMLLKDQGKLTYETSVKEIFPELPTHMHEITVKQLMQHSSGLKRTHYGEPDGLTNEDIFQNFLKAKEDTLMFKPGTDLRYSNSGYMMLAMIVEKVSGQNFEAFLQEHVWGPLGMTNTYVMSEDDYSRHNRSIGFNGYGEKADFNVLTYGSNGIYSSTEDLFRWTQSFNTDLLIDLDERSKAWEAATTNSGEPLFDPVGGYKWNYGFGLFICNDDLEGVVGHTGAYGGFFNIMMHDLINDRDIIILTNNGRRLPLAEAGVAVQNILRNKPYTLPKISIDYELRKNHYHDIDKAISYYYRLKETAPDRYKFKNEWELNTLGYALIADDRLEDAIKILKLLVSEFPDRPNPYDSLGEAYYLHGQYKSSLESYEKALEVDPTYNAEWIAGMLQKNREKLKGEL